MFITYFSFSTWNFEFQDGCWWNSKWPPVTLVKSLGRVYELLKMSHIFKVLLHPKPNNYFLVLKESPDLPAYEYACFHAERFSIRGIRGGNITRNDRIWCRQYENQIFSATSYKNCLILKNVIQAPHLAHWSSFSCWLIYIHMVPRIICIYPGAYMYMYWLAHVILTIWLARGVNIKHLYISISQT